jgi:DNA-binding response OmpR family regulator
MISVDATSETATVAGSPCPLRSADFRLLKYLVEREGRWFSELELLREVFENRSSLETSVVRVHVFTLRRSLGAGGRCIQSKRGHGYRFVNL